MRRRRRGPLKLMLILAAPKNPSEERAASECPSRDNATFLPLQRERGERERGIEREREKGADAEMSSELSHSQRRRANAAAAAAAVDEERPPRRQSQGHFARTAHITTAPPEQSHCCTDALPTPVLSTKLGGRRSTKHRVEGVTRRVIKTHPGNFGWARNGCLRPCNFIPSFPPSFRQQSAENSRAQKSEGRRAKFPSGTGSGMRLRQEVRRSRGERTNETSRIKVRKKAALGPGLVRRRRAERGPQKPGGPGPRDQLPFPPCFLPGLCANSVSLGFQRR